MSDADPSPADMPDNMKRSSCDPAQMRGNLQSWLAGQVGSAENPEIVEFSSPESNGMSSETLLVDAVWGTGDARVHHELAVRVAPAPTDVPVFPTYDLEMQFRLMGLVGSHSEVPVPKTYWYEPSSQPLGAPFFVMARASGEAAPDIPPYPFGSWVTEGSEEDRRRMQDGAVAVLAGIHSIDLASVDVSFLEIDRPGDTALQRHVNWWRDYYDWAREGRRHPIVEEAFTWLDNNWPQESPTVISWGDSRIGNTLWNNFEPTAVLDWEMAAVGPRELDIGWMTFLHTFFQDLTEQFEMPGLPAFMRADDVAATYEQITGVAPVDLHWYETYCAARHAVIMARVHARSVHFGQGKWGSDVDEPIIHRHRLAQMISS